MFIGHTSPKLWVSINVIVGLIDLFVITELRKKQLKVEILPNLKEFLKGIFNKMLNGKKSLVFACCITKY